MKAMLDPEKDLKGATPEKLARALLRPLRPRRRREAVVRDQVTVEKVSTDKAINELYARTDAMQALVKILVFIQDEETKEVLRALAENIELKRLFGDFGEHPRFRSPDALKDYRRHVAATFTHLLMEGLQPSGGFDFRDPGPSDD